MTCVSRTLAQMNKVFKPQQKAFTALLGALTRFRGKATMRNLSRYGAGSERQLRRWASQAFNFIELNRLHLAREQVITRTPHGVAKGSPKQAILLDATFLRKSGHCTEGLNYFHNGSSRAVNKLERGLEMTLLAVADLKERSAYALSMHQSLENKSALDIAKEEIKDNATKLRELARHVVADGYYARESFVSALEDANLDLITALRHDAALRYLHVEPYTGRGRPKVYGNRLDYNDLSLFEYHDGLRSDSKVYSKIMNYSAWNRNILVVIQVNPSGHRRIICSTDINLSPQEVLELYEVRFQIEFLFRDAKQHTGLGDAQVLDSQGLVHFANLSLVALNLLRIEDRQSALSQGVSLDQHVCSINRLKLRNYNDFLLRRFMATLGLELKCAKVSMAYQEAQEFGLNAA
jgi:hypothetical protein